MTMSTLAAAFGLAWVAVVAYLSWLSRNNRQLALRLKALEETAKEKPGSNRRKRAA
jgi:CcmD family protein